jgi:hypothetical protein
MALGITMEEKIYGDIDAEGLEVIRRDGRLFVRYDAGAHQVVWREDEISQADLERMKGGEQAEYRVLLEVQKRIERSGQDPYVSNWKR